jgi:cardiolipin hydrolase
MRQYHAVSLAACLLLGLALPAGGAAVRVYFSPQDNPQQVVLNALQGAAREILVAMFEVTDGTLAQALIAARQRGVDVRIVMDDGKARNRASRYPELARALGDRVALRSGTGSQHAIMHDKFAVLDGREVLTGSYNWSKLAGCCNRENLVVIDDPAVAAQYAREFHRLWAAPGR